LPPSTGVGQSERGHQHNAGQLVKRLRPEHELMGPVKHPGGADPAVGQGGGASLPDVEFGRRALREDARIVGEPLSPPVELPYAEAGSDYSESQQAREEQAVLAQHSP